MASLHFGVGMVRQTIGKIKHFFTVKKEAARKSSVSTFYGDRWEIANAYKHLIDKEDISITSVSITQVVDSDFKNHKNNFLIVVSYDYCN